ncbi:CopG family antitoxin [Anabaena sp. UHCC 0204]|uniref:CopG family antitoxin n=1 Tax=Anabaena sp. UHCC 0204 TaxID=2590009 RepID=UPI0020C3A65E|nr:CopG family antitoxin [Anabaena sp. UHCC 0204]
MGKVGYLRYSRDFDWDKDKFMTKKIVPRVKTDEEIEALLENDLSDYLYPRNFQPVTFEFTPKDKSVNVLTSE